MQINSIHQEDNQIHCEISNISSRDDKEEEINDNEDVANEKPTEKENQLLNETEKVIKNKDENEVKKETKNKRIMRGNNNLKKNSNLDKEEGFQTASKILDSQILGGGSYQTPPENFNSKILGEGNYQTSPGNFNSQILGGGSYQTPPENFNPRITEECFHTSLVNSTPVDCEEGSNQTSLRNATLPYSKESKEKNSLIFLENIKFPKVGMSKRDNYNQNNTSHVTIKELIERVQLYRPNIKTFYKKKNKPSSKILASTQIQSQEMIEKFMRKRKSKRKEEKLNNNVKSISHECFILSEEPKKDRLSEITELLRLEHLDTQEKRSVINLISESQDRFHIPGEKLTATQVLQHQIPTTDDQPINTRQYGFPQIHKEEINKQVEELLEGGIVKPSQSPYNTPIWIIPKKEDSKGNKRWSLE